jgi:spoIIIJ-associated protein
MLGARREEVDVQIIKEGSRGVLGIGAEDAQVRLSIKPKPKPEPPPPVPQAPPPAPKTEEEPVVEAPSEADAGTDLDETTAAQIGREVLTDMLRLMGIQATVESKLGYELAEEDQPPPMVLNITGEDLGILIGRRGETLRALQYLVRLMVGHRLKHWTDLVVDVENYRVRRRAALESLASRVAEEVVKTGRSQSLEPMPAYERRLVHIALRKNPDVTTQSFGEGEKRKVTVFPNQ